VTSGGTNFNDFPENPLTISREVYTVKANRGPKQNFVVIRLRKTRVE